MVRRNGDGTSGERLGLLAGAVRNLRLVWRLMKDPELPLRARLIPLIVLAYLVFPGDLLPDYILGLGQLDDVAVILLAFRLFVSSCPPELVQRHLHGMDVIDGEYQELDDDE
jgi:uncharacterized membrane protein YkvA (DUF1232 family)